MKGSIKLRALAVLLVLGLAGGLQACNTVHGAGQDMKQAGQGVENTADRNK